MYLLSRPLFIGHAGFQREVGTCNRVWFKAIYLRLCAAVVLERTTIISVVSRHNLRIRAHTVDGAGHRRLPTRVVGRKVYTSCVHNNIMHIIMMPYTRAYVWHNRNRGIGNPDRILRCEYTDIYYSVAARGPHARHPACPRVNFTNTVCIIHNNIIMNGDAMSKNDKF